MIDAMSIVASVDEEGIDILGTTCTPRISLVELKHERVAAEEFWKFPLGFFKP